LRQVALVTLFTRAASSIGIIYKRPFLGNATFPLMFHASVYIKNMSLILKIKETKNTKNINVFINSQKFSKNENFSQHLRILYVYVTNIAEK
jgi:hypothetical protein